jgi:RNA polymerase sigma factor (sigma-70 family)
MAANDIDQQEAVAFAEQLENIMTGLDEEERQIVQLRLDGHDSQEIARRLQCSTRTVRRITSRIRERLTRELSSDLSSRHDDG